VSDPIAEPGNVLLPRVSKRFPVFPDLSKGPAPLVPGGCDPRFRGEVMLVRIATICNASH
jgi:hypothetical protein